MEQLHIKSDVIPLLEFSGENLFREHGALRTFRRNALIYAPGDAAEQVHLIAHGEVKVSRYTAEGRELTLGLLTGGDIFGDMEILLGTSRECQTMARAESGLYALERELLLSLIAEEPRFGLWVTRMMGRRQSRLEERLESLLFKSANGKVAQVLLHLAATHGQRVGEGVLIDYPITHQEIGNLIATTRETVSYAFIEFRERGLITTRQRRTIVRDMAELGAVALD